MSMVKSLANDANYLDLPGALQLAERIKDFWKRRNITVSVLVEKVFFTRDRVRSVYVIHSDIASRPEFRTTRIPLPVKYMGRFLTVSV